MWHLPISSLSHHCYPPSPHGFELFRDLPQCPVDLEVGPLLEVCFTQGTPTNLRSNRLKERREIKQFQQIKSIPVDYCITSTIQYPDVLKYVIHTLALLQYSLMHPKQKLWPQGVDDGLVKRSRQMEHWNCSSDKKLPCKDILWKKGESVLIIHAACILLEAVFKVSFIHNYSFFFFF